MLIIHGTEAPLYTEKNMSHSVYPPILVKYGARWIIENEFNGSMLNAKHGS